MAPGSLSGDATEVFQEGLRLPAIKIIDKGNPITPLFDVIKVNSRMPDVLEGDVWAAIASARIGAGRLQELARKYGVDTFTTTMRNFMDHGEKVARAAMADLPRGRFELAEDQDDGAVYKVAITITGDEFLIDLRDNPDQSPGPVNAVRDGVMIAAHMIFKNLTDAHGPANGGSFRPVTVLTRKGSIFDAAEPAANGFYYEVLLRVYDLLWRCLAPHLDGRLASGHFASVCGTFIGGTHPDTGRQYTIIEPQIGGWGGRQGVDGNSAMFCGFHGETYNCPAEINEARNGVWVDRMELNMAPGGEGEFTGGRGIVMDYRVRAANGYLTAGYTRSKYPAWAMGGGAEGSSNLIEYRPKGGDPVRHSFVSGLSTKPGDVIRVITGNGGGYGDPRKRAPEAVAMDVKNGLLTPQRAREIYGWEG